MTAQEMGQRFLDELNQAHNQDIPSWEIASWLTQAQQMRYNELFFNVRQQSGEGRPPHSFQGTGYIAEALSRFERQEDVSTTNKGFFFDSDVDSLLNRYTAIYVVDYENDCDTQTEVLYEARYMRDMNKAARSGNVYERARWDDAGVPDYLHRQVYYHFGNKSNPASGNTERGVQMLPKRKYSKVRAEYIINPPAIEIANNTGPFGYESTFYSGNAAFVSTTADVDSLMPEDMHEAIVQEAVALFFKSQPDYQGYQVEQQAVNQGGN
jgi:hypothetical protein